MSGVVLVIAGVVSWLLRVAFIVIVPARHLPEGIRRSLDNAALAALAALLATALTHDGGGGTLVVPTPELIATIVAGIVAWRTRHLGLTVVVAVLVLWGVQLAAAV